VRRCAERIVAPQVEYEVNLTSGKTILLHPPCHVIWLEECAPDAPPAPSTP
jgi:hypothetical protein